jgi:F0F1-type ATP synthase assembly protein I
VDGGPGLGDLLSLGTTLASCLVLGFGAGWLVDRAASTFPIFSLVGLALGVIAACFAFYKTFKRYSGRG